MRYRNKGCFMLISIFIKFLLTQLNTFLNISLKIFFYHLIHFYINDMPRRKEFAVNMLQRISEDEAFLK